MTDTISIGDAMRSHEGEMRRRNFTDASTRTYAAILTRFRNYLGETTDIAQVTPQVCRSFFDETWSDGQQPGTINLAMTVVSSFFTFAEQVDYIDRNPMPKVSRPNNIPLRDRKRTRITTDEVVMMQNACQTWPERMAINTFALTGVRRTALANLRWRDVNGKAWTAAFVEKGRKRIVKPVPHDLRKVWTAYAIAEGPFSDDDWVVPNRSPLGHTDERSARFLYAIVRDVAERVGVKAHCHSLRAAYAVEFLRRNPDQLEALRRLMGHSSMQTTLGYVDGLQDEELMQLVETLTFGGIAVSA